MFYGLSVSVLWILAKNDGGEAEGMTEGWANDDSPLRGPPMSMARLC